MQACSGAYPSRLTAFRVRLRLAKSKFLRSFEGADHWSCRRHMTLTWCPRPSGDTRRPLRFGDRLMMKSTASTDHFGNWAESVSRLLAEYRDFTSTTSNHGEVLGKAREFFVSQVLRRFLPQALHIGGGQIVDADGSLSRQIDTLIYRHDMPLLSSLA